MSKAACKEEENSLLLEAMGKLRERIRLFESYMKQGLATEDEIEGRIKADRNLRPFLNNACEEYRKVNSVISARGGD